MNLLTRTRLRLVAFIVVSSAACSIAFAQSGKPILVRAAYVPIATWLAAWVAKDQGMFEKHGLEVTLLPVQNISLVPATLGKQIDIGPATPPDLIKSAASGLDVVGVAGAILEHSSRAGSALVVRKDSGITSIQGLKGKVVATPTLGAILHTGVLYWLKKSGVDPNSIRAVEVPFPNMGDQLKSGRVDAIEAAEPFLSGILAAGNVSLGSMVAPVADPSRNTLWIAQGEWARANRDTIARWIASQEDAKRFIEENPAGARSILGKYTKLPEAVVQKIPLPTYETSLKVAEIDAWVRALREIGQLPREVDASRLVFTGK